jgi:mlo protein
VVQNHKLGMKYNFHGYIQRTMEDDFKVVVGISAYLWAFVVIFLLLNVHGWYTYFWIAFIPFILILLVGTKLQQIITDLALEVRASVKPIETPLEEVNSTVIKNLDDPQGQELVCNHVRPRDDLFWFSRPQLVLYLIHFILFQNAFELAYFFWILKTFGITSCIMGKAWVVIVRLVIGVFVQVLCSYSTLPLYALVTQMGSNIKLSIFQESTELAIHGWREKAKERQKKRKLNHHSESSPIRKIFGPSSRSRYHNSQLQHSVKLSQGESHTTPSVPSGDVDRHHQHTEDIRGQERPSNGSHTVEIVEQPSAATAQGEQQPAPAPVTSGIATNSNPHSLHAVNQLLMAKRNQSQGDTN